MELPSPMYLGSGGSDSSHFGYCNDPSLNIGGPSLQEMIDSDMKADFDDVLTGNSLNFQVGYFKMNYLSDLERSSRSKKKILYPLFPLNLDVQLL